MWELPPLRVWESRDPDQVLRITLEGELDVSVSDQLSIRLEQLRLGGTPVRLDLSGLTFSDSSAIHVLSNAMRNASTGDEPLLEIVYEVTPSVRTVIELAGIELMLWPPREHVG